MTKISKDIKDTFDFIYKQLSKDKDGIFLKQIMTIADIEKMHDKYQILSEDEE